MPPEPPAAPTDLAGLEEELQTRWLGHPCLLHGQVESTNDLADALAEQAAAHGTVVLADSQRRGRGRLQRPWHSPPGANLYLSAVLRPPLAPAAAPPLSLAAAVGVAEAATALSGRAPTVKWPNDLLYEGRKLCGILLELRAEAYRAGAPGKVRHVILGVGLNVNLQRFPPELPPATSLALECGRRLERRQVARQLLASLERWLTRYLDEGIAPVLAAWQRHAPWLGQRVTVSQGGAPLAGIALGLSPRGELRLRLDSGQERLIAAGEVLLEPEP